MKRQTACIASLVAVVTLAPSVAADYQILYTVGMQVPLEPEQVEFIGDIDGDGVLETVGYLSGISALVIRDGMTGTVEFQHDPVDNFSSIRVEDLDGDGTPEVMYFTSSSLRVIDYIPTASAPDGRNQSRLGVFPNPSIQDATLTFSLESASQVDLRVFDVEGRLVKTIASGQFVAGPHEVSWDGTADSGQRLAAGTYFYRLTVNGQAVGSQKAVKLR